MPKEPARTGLDDTADPRAPRAVHKAEAADGEELRLGRGFPRPVEDDAIERELAEDDVDEEEHEEVNEAP